MTAMTTNTQGQGWRIAGWGLLAALLALPAVAMQFTAEVNWTVSDFVTMGVLFALLGLGGELVARKSASGWYRAGMGVALLTAFLLIWVNLAVGIIGSEQNDANLMFAGVLAVGVGGACLARVAAAGMAAAMVATAAAHTLVAVIALIAGAGADGPIWPRDLIGTTIVFDGLWLASALLFRRAAR